MLATLRGIVSLFLYAFGTALLALIILISSPLIAIIPFKKARFYLRKHFLQRTPEWYDRWNSMVMAISTRKKWDILGTGELQRDQWYVMMSNHRSWLDILVLGKVFHGRIPPLKFFMKKELLWQLPLAGLACYALGYPFMSRHSHAQIRKNPSLKGKDIEAARAACNTLRHYPTTLINFLEGTRFTEKKKARQQSPYEHLLKPHAGGAAVVIQELHDILAGMINVTICYPKKTPSVWEFACGKFEKVIVRYDVVPITPDVIGDYYQDRAFRAYIQQYFNTWWKEKDALIGRVK